MPKVWEQRHSNLYVKNFRFSFYKLITSFFFRYKKVSVIANEDFLIVDLFKILKYLKKAVLYLLRVMENDSGRKINSSIKDNWYSYQSVVISRADIIMWFDVLNEKPDYITGYYLSTKYVKFRDNQFRNRIQAKTHHCTVHRQRTWLLLLQMPMGLLHIILSKHFLGYWKVFLHICYHLFIELQF